MGENYQDVEALVEPLQQLHRRIRDCVVLACEHSSMELMTKVDEIRTGDTVFAIDQISRRLLVNFFTSEIAPQTSVVLLAEGLPDGKLVLPQGTSEDEAVWRVVVDELDGTRNLMYQKRSGWVITGVAPNLGAATRLSDIVLAVQTEVPLVKQFLSDELVAVKGKGVRAKRYNRLTDKSEPLNLQPSRADTIAQGYAMIARFFPGPRAELAAIDEEIVSAVLGPARTGEPSCFEDQYVATAGQLYELMAGHDRFVADLRPQMQRSFADRGLVSSKSCHPYNICTELIARELGVIVAAPDGAPLDAPLTLEANVAWAGYANAAIRDQVQPHLKAALQRRNLL
jgi:fructose-1,6-bisphosphatase/inositol monophosphatase family enzyme